MNNKPIVELNNYIVYAHINKSNGKLYIGITCQPPEHRWGRNGNRYKGCDRFYKAIQHYGWKNFNHEIWKKDLSFKQACYWEQFYIQRYKTNDGDHGYNLTSGGQEYSKHSDETKLKMSHKAKGSGNSQFGKRHSKDHCEKISDGCKEFFQKRTDEDKLEFCRKNSRYKYKLVEDNIIFDSLADAIHYLHPEMTIGSVAFKRQVEALEDRLKPGRNGIFKKNLHFIKLTM